MKIVCKVCAEFRDPDGAFLFSVRSRDRLSILEAPEAIRKDPLFDMLIRDRSLEVLERREDLKKAEHEPLAVLEKAEKAEKVEKAEKAEKAGRAGTGKAAAGAEAVKAAGTAGAAGAAEAPKAAEAARA